jgi:Zn-dependent peptidase ImmA (M78 family)/transcriptional regulator with XRE-family HTH domain
VASARASGDRIRQAREIRGMTQMELAALIGVEQSHVSHLEQGIRDPSPETLQRVAMATQFSVAFFRQSSGPEFPLGSLLYRRRMTLPSAERDRLRQVAGLAFETYMLMAERFRPIDMRIPRTTGADPKDAAQLTRSALGLSPDTPVTHLINKLEKNGVFVLALPFDIKQHDAFSVWADTDPRRPVIVLTGGWPGDRQRFTVSHELGHLVMHQAIAGPISEMDEQADAFASEFLLPEEAMKRDLCVPLTLTSLAELKAKWGVSIQALIRRAEGLEIVTEGQRKYVEKQLVKHGWIREEPVRIEPEKPRLLMKLAESLYGIPVSPATVASNTAAPTKLMEAILLAHASQSEIARTSNPNRNMPGPLALVTKARR